MSEKIIEKIRKLIALGTNDGATEGERENAMRMAHALLAKHNLDENDIATEGMREKRVMSSCIKYKAIWIGYISVGIAELFFCRVFTTGLSGSANIKNADKKMIYTFVGKQSNVETAKEMFDWIVSAISKEKRKGGWKESFCIAAGSKIQERCMQISTARKPISEGKGLMVVDLHDSERAENDKFIEDNGFELNENKRKERKLEAQAYRAGKEYGEKIRLNTQLGQ